MGFISQLPIVLISCSNLLRSTKCTGTVDSQSTGFLTWNLATNFTKIYFFLFLFLFFFDVMSPLRHCYILLFLIMMFGSGVITQLASFLLLQTGRKLMDDEQ